MPEPTVEQVAQAIYDVQNYDGPAFPELGIEGEEYRQQAHAVRALYALGREPEAWRVDMGPGNWLLTSEEATGARYRAAGYAVTPLYPAAGREADR